MQAHDLRRARIDAEALSLARTRELRRVLDALVDGALRPLAIKGAHLAYTIYDSPALRPRSDTDLLLPQEEHARAAEVLDALGYRRSVHVRGTLILGQSHFEHEDAAGLTHSLDLHWRVVAPLVLRDALPVEVLLRDAVPMPALGPSARGPSLPHALAIACLHAIAHHRDAIQPFWLRDIDLIAARLDERQSQDFVETIRRGRAATVALAALRTAREASHHPRVGDLVTRLESGVPADEPSARLLTTRRKIDELWLDLRAAQWRERATLLKEHLLPDAAYMRASRGGPRWLPLAYAARAASGLREWVRPTTAEGRRTAAPDESSAGSAAASARRST